MVIILTVVFITATMGLVFPLVLYFPLLFLLSRLRTPLAAGNAQPSVSLIVSAFNEVGIIREKIENSLALDYSKDRLEVLVISDGSDDGTDNIVLE